MKRPFVEPSTLQELIQQITIRPAMFVGVAKFELVAAFISGYDHAMGRWVPDQRSKPNLWDFSRWVSHKLGYPNNWHWAFTIREAFPNDEDAFRALPELYQEFISEMTFKESNE